MRIGNSPMLANQKYVEHGQGAPMNRRSFRVDASSVWFVAGAAFVTVAMIALSIAIGVDPDMSMLAAR
jgi:hypothetical protein